ncbi:glycosyltransferase family 2 protein [Methylomonas sp. 2BW1-5-20]|uniref:glycosyltransferase family 2 protein n=1 Tax=Methylomonas sp. 2BW1-5-20 TaxID=3376686 RepID=UPI00404E4DA5
MEANIKLHDMNLPMISIVVAVYNGADTLKQCIDSVLSQTFANKELIVIDGGSCDGTIELLEANSQINYWISEPDTGVYNAWNKALSHVKGEWICFLGADDYFWNNQVLERMAQELAVVSSSISVAYGSVMLLNSQGDTLYPIGDPWGAVKQRFKQVMSVPHPGLMHRRSLFERQGQFDESFRIGGDYEFLLRELKTAEAFFIPDLITVAMRQGGLSSTPFNSLESLMDARRAQKLHGQVFPGPVWLSAVIRIYIRLFLWEVVGENSARKLMDIGRKIMGRPPYWTKT